MSGPAGVGNVTYTVRRGDSLWEIARRSGISLAELRQLNGIPDEVSLIHPGQQLRVPAPPAAKPTAPESKTRRVELLIPLEEAQRLGESERHAYAVFVALAQEPMLVAHLKRALGIGNPPNTPKGVQVVGSQAVARLAQEAKDVLTEAGLLQLKRRAGIGEEGVGFETAHAVADLLIDEAVRPNPVRRFFMSERSQFIERIGEAAAESQRETGVPASVVMAQCILETGWGKHVMGRAKNYFGIKGRGPAGSVTLPTREFVNGRWVTVNERFRAYRSVAESFADHARLLSENTRYARAMAVKDDPKAFARALQRAGYATDPHYARKLIEIMDEHDLYRFDAQPRQG